ncbi:hypothetical protein [Methanoregula sp.]|jgi:hypothetical protein|uniref:hypothetical protein n=1 Tax=Methanoregula sp. TaxID=2052170 RepID=UPI003C21D03F
MSQIIIDTAAIKKAVIYGLAIIGLVCIIVIGAYAVIHSVSPGMSSASVLPVTTVPVITATPVPTQTMVMSAPTAAAFVAAPAPVVIPQTPTEASFTVQSINTIDGYIGAIDVYGNEYIVLSYDASIQYEGLVVGSSYTGQVVSSYDGVPMLQDVTLVGEGYESLPTNVVDYVYTGNYYHDDGYSSVPVEHITNNQVVSHAPPHYSNPRTPMNNDYLRTNPPPVHIDTNMTRTR